MLELLESRLFLSVTLRGGTLLIVGTGSDDQIQLSHPSWVDQSRTNVDFNGTRYSFRTSPIKRVIIKARGGDDRIQIGVDPIYTICGAGVPWPPDPFPFLPTVPTRLIGGADADTILGGPGDDIILGGPGSDVLFGEAGKDVLIGGDGNDGLNGGWGDDTLLGQAGDDGLSGNGALSGIDGEDYLSGGSGDDTLFADPAIDRLSGGSGDDLLLYPVYRPSNDDSVPPPIDVPSDIERREAFLTEICL